MSEEEKPRCDFCGEEVSARRDCAGCKLLHEVGLAQAEAYDAAIQAKKNQKRMVFARATAMKKQTDYQVLLEKQKKDEALRLAYARDPNKSIAELIAPVPKVDLATVMAPAAPTPSKHPRSGK